jgi:hypothetical protein
LTCCQLIPRIGNFITGSFVPDEEDVLSAERRRAPDGREYNYYELLTPYSKAGAHSLAAFTAKVKFWARAWGLVFSFIWVERPFGQSMDVETRMYVVWAMCRMA